MNEQTLETIRPDDVVEYLSNCFQDENTRSLLFASLSVSRKNIRGAQPIFRMVYMGALLCYLYWKNNNHDSQNDDYLEIKDLCNSLFSENALTLESAIYLLFLIRNDVKNNPNSLFVSCMDKDEECEYGKIYGLLDEWNSSSEKILVYYKSYHVLSFLMTITKSLRILREIKIHIDQDNVSFDFDGKTYSFGKYLKYVQDTEYFTILLKEENEYFDLRNLVKI